MTSAKRVVGLLGECAGNIQKSESYRLHRAAKPCFPGLARSSMGDRLRWRLAPTGLRGSGWHPRAAVARIQQVFVFIPGNPCRWKFSGFIAQFCRRSRKTTRVVATLHPVLLSLA
jgi:hypothetical protein